jgi:hypothetical protein
MFSIAGVHVAAAPPFPEKPPLPEKPPVPVEQARQMGIAVAPKPQHSRVVPYAARQ